MGAADPASPEEIAALGPEETDGLLRRLEADVPHHPPFSTIPGTGRRGLVVFGDSHGDWESTRWVVERYRGAGPTAGLVGLGDYIDRGPGAHPRESLTNALYVLSLAAREPERVLLIQGNHETARRLGVSPAHLRQEVRELWGADGGRYDRLMALFERGPLAAATENGVYLAHAGFPLGSPTEPWTAAFASLDEERLAQVVWAECAASRIRRGAASPFTENDLALFLDRTGARVFLRGHDPDLAGRSVYGGRCLTLHTTRVYERYGGILRAWVPLDRPVRSTDDIQLERR